MSKSCLVFKNIQRKTDPCLKHTLPMTADQYHTQEKHERSETKTQIHFPGTVDSLSYSKSTIEINYIL